MKMPPPSSSSGVGGDGQHGRMESPAPTSDALCKNNNNTATTTPPTPPPGFSSPGSAGDPRVILLDGEQLRGGDGTLSAPLPPDMDVMSHNDRVQLASHAIWDDGMNRQTVATERLHWGQQQQQQSAALGGEQQQNAETNCYSNLAAMVGAGLAETMEESTQDSKLRFGAGADEFYGLSFTRQSRHAANRMIGASGSGLSPTASALLGLFPTQKRRSENSRLFNASTFTNNNNNRSREPPSTVPQFSHPEQDPLAEFKASVQHRQGPSALPLSMFGGAGDNHNTFQPSVGVTVMEPDVSGRNTAEGSLNDVLSGCSTPINVSRQGTPDLAEQIQRLHVTDNGRRSAQSDANSSSQHSASEFDLDPFLWDVQQLDASRTIVILRAVTITVSDIRTLCESFGALEVFRTEFSERGIIFVGYYDIRSAQYAAHELKQNLSRMAHGATEIDVKYCVPLNFSSSHDESVLVLSDIPQQLSEQMLRSMLTSYGAVRSTYQQPGNYYGRKSYTVEFHSIQDAKLALLELENNQALGNGVSVEVGVRRAADRKRGRELLSVISKWRQSNNYGETSPPRNFNADRSFSPPTMRDGRSFNRTNNESITGGSTIAPQTAAQLVLGPDGQYSYVMVDPAAYPHGHHHHQQQGHHHGDPGMAGAHQGLSGHQQHLVHGPHGSYITSVAPVQAHAGQQQHYWNSLPQHHHHQQQQSQQQQQQQYRTVGAQSNKVPYAVETSQPYSSGGSGGSVPYYAHVVTTQTDSSVSSGGSSNPNPAAATPVHAPQPNRRQQNDNKDNRHLLLDLVAVQAGRDARTSLMVRNIPNKYTQQMLLAEFTDHGVGPGKIDFFYLPIDFKNRCNRGYAFINFVDYKDIIVFHRQYAGQPWRVFKSDKICDITYARIQGKEAMLKRFENSALMEKDEEYKPLVFVSHGPDKGKRQVMGPPPMHH